MSSVYVPFLSKTNCQFCHDFYPNKKNLKVKWGGHMSVKHSPVVVRLSSPSLPLCSACCWPPLVLAVAGAGGGRWLVCIYPDCYKHFLVMLTHRLPKCKNKHKPRSEVQRASNLIKQNKLKYNDASFRFTVCWRTTTMQCWEPQNCHHFIIFPQVILDLMPQKCNALIF